MASFAQFGNDLHTGARSFNIVGRRKTWYLVAAIMILIAIVGPILRGEVDVEGDEVEAAVRGRLAGIEHDVRSDAVRQRDDRRDGSDEAGDV